MNADAEMEDTGTGWGWRLMEQRLPSIPSLQSDLLITHGSGFFFLSPLVMQISRGDAHSQRKATFDIIGSLIFPLRDDALAAAGLYE